jgi:hypothetical protein
MLAAVESLEARVISRLPFRPSRAGTMIRISDTSLKQTAIKLKTCMKISWRNLLNFLRCVPEDLPLLNVVENESGRHHAQARDNKGGEHLKTKTTGEEFVTRHIVCLSKSGYKKTV